MNSWHVNMKQLMYVCAKGMWYELLCSVWQDENTVNSIQYYNIALVGLLPSQ